MTLLITRTGAAVHPTPVVEIPLLGAPVEVRALGLLLTTRALLDPVTGTRLATVRRRDHRSRAHLRDMTSLMLLTINQRAKMYTTKQK